MLGIGLRLLGSRAALTDPTPPSYAPVREGGHFLSRNMYVGWSCCTGSPTAAGPPRRYSMAIRCVAPAAHILVFAFVSDPHCPVRS